MKVFDKKVKQHIGIYIFQCFLATLAIFIIFLFLDVLKQTAIIASLGATAFIVFTTPKRYTSRARPLLGGYALGISVGVLCSLAANSSWAVETFLHTEILYIVFGSISVGLSIFLMVVSDTEHPPASSIALGLVINDWSFRTIIFICSGVLVLYFVKTLLNSFLVDLR